MFITHVNLWSPTIDISCFCYNGSPWFCIPIPPNPSKDYCTGGTYWWLQNNNKLQLPQCRIVFRGMGCIRTDSQRMGVCSHIRDHKVPQTWAESKPDLHSAPGERSESCGGDRHRKYFGKSYWGHVQKTYDFGFDPLSSWELIKRGKRVIGVP